MGVGVIANRTFDTDLIKDIMIELWDTVAEDGVKPGEYKPNVDDECWVEMLVGDKCIGVYRVHALNSATLQIHAQILPEYRKEYSKATGRRILSWISENAEDNYQKVVAEVPTIYPNVIKFVIANGFKLEGVNRLSYRKDGVLYDQCLMGITRPEIEDFLGE